MKKFFTLCAMTVMLAFSSQAAYYIVGNVPFGNWNPAAGVEMTANSDGTYSYEMTRKWKNPRIIFNDGAEDGSVQYPEKKGLKVEADKTYKVE